MRWQFCTWNLASNRVPWGRDLREPCCWWSEAPPPGGEALLPCSRADSQFSARHRPEQKSAWRVLTVTVTRASRCLQAWTPSVSSTSSVLWTRSWSGLEYSAGRSLWTTRRCTTLRSPRGWVPSGSFCRRWRRDLSLTKRRGWGPCTWRSTRTTSTDPGGNRRVPDSPWSTEDLRHCTPCVPRRGRPSRVSLCLRTSRLLTIITWRVCQPLILHCHTTSGPPLTPSISPSSSRTKRPRCPRRPRGTLPALPSPSSALSTRRSTRHPRPARVCRHRRRSPSSTISHHRTSCSAPAPRAPAPAPATPRPPPPPA